MHAPTAAFAEVAGVGFIASFLPSYTRQEHVLAATFRSRAQPQVQSCRPRRADARPAADGDARVSLVSCGRLLPPQIAILGDGRPLSERHVGGSFSPARHAGLL